MKGAAVLKTGKRKFIEPRKISPEEFGAALVRIPELKAKLTAVTERMNAGIAAAERALGNLGLGVPGRVCFPDGERWLYLEKRGIAEWRLLVVYEDEGEEELLGSASRETRIQALALLPHLVLALCKTSMDETERITKLVGQTAEYLSLVQAAGNS